MNILKQAIVKTNDWPISKRYLIRKNFKIFSQFGNKIPFDEINVAQIRCRDSSKFV